MVECADNKCFPADVIGYSEEYMTIDVRFHADNLQKPGRCEEKRPSFGYGTTYDDDTNKS